MTDEQYTRATLHRTWFTWPSWLVWAVLEERRYDEWYQELKIIGDKMQQQ